MVIMHKLTIFIFALAALCLSCDAKVFFTRCELVRELKRQEFPAYQLRDWVCLIEAESNRNTALVGPVTYNGSRDWGLFQINDKHWCSTTKHAGKRCHVRCTDLITDNISKASKCAKLIYKRHNFNAWYGWFNKCKGKALPDISKC